MKTRKEEAGTLDWWPYPPPVVSMAGLHLPLLLLSFMVCSSHIPFWGIDSNSRVVHRIIWLHYLDECLYGLSRRVKKLLELGLTYSILYLLLQNWQVAFCHKFGAPPNHRTILFFAVTQKLPLPQSAIPGSGGTKLCSRSVW